MKIHEYFYPTIDWKPFKDSKITDYAEIELEPEEDDYELLENLDRYAQKAMLNKETLAKLNNPHSGYYEHIIAYVHFLAGTEELDKISYIVVSEYEQTEIKPKIDDITRQKIISEAKKSLKKYRGTNLAILGR